MIFLDAEDDFIICTGGLDCSGWQKGESQTMCQESRFG